MSAPPPSPRLALCVALTLAAGCGGYAGTSQAFRRSLDAGRPADALSRVDGALGVDRPDQRPDEISKDTPLLLLERATILQSMGRYAQSSADFEAADQHLEVLDLSSDTVGNISKYLFSDDGTLYKTPPHEKLLLNTFNMINYLARGDLKGARVEARRFLVNRKYLKDAEGDARGMMALGSYLAGFTFEQSGRGGPALRHYGDVYDSGGAPTLERVSERLMALSGARDGRLVKAFGPPKGERPSRDGRADLLVIVQTGMAPYLVPERLPVGAALVAASDPGGGARLSNKQRRRAQVFAAKGVLKWVNYPKLVRVRGQGGPATVSADGRPMEGGLALDVERRVLSQHERIKGSLIAASLTRLVARAVAGEASQAIAKRASNSGLAGLLVGLAVEGAMTAADTPDTRSWVTLPGRVHIARARLPAGAHRVTVRYRGRLRSAPVTLAPNGWALLNFSDLR